jgi:hypothetical protein
MGTPVGSARHMGYSIGTQYGVCTFAFEAGRIGSIKVHARVLVVYSPGIRYSELALPVRPRPVKKIGKPRNNEYEPGQYRTYYHRRFFSSL